MIRLLVKLTVIASIVPTASMAATDEPAPVKSKTPRVEAFSVRQKVNNKVEIVCLAPRESELAFERRLSAKASEHGQAGWTLSSVGAANLRGAECLVLGYSQPNLQ